MGQRNHHQNKRQNARGGSARAPLYREPLAPPVRKAPVVYGKPFVVLEDDQANTFIYKGGQWVRHTQSIAEYEQGCQVKKLAQRINGMNRYEISEPVSDSE